MGYINRIGGAGGLAAMRAAVKALGPTLLLDADLIAGNDGDAIGTWADDSGNAHNFSQATASKKPLLKKADNGINGHNVLHFDGVDDEFESGAKCSNFITTTADTFWVVFKILSIDSNATPYVQNNDAAIRFSVYRGLVFRSAPTALSFTNDYVHYPYAAVVSISTSIAYIARARHSGDDVYLALNGGSEASSDSPGVSSNISGAVASIGTSAHIDIAEIIVFNSALSAADMQVVDAYLKAKYATY